MNIAKANSSLAVVPAGPWERCCLSSDKIPFSWTPLQPCLTWPAASGLPCDRGHMEGGRRGQRVPELTEWLGRRNFEKVREHIQWHSTHRIIAQLNKISRFNIFLMGKSDISLAKGVTIQLNNYIVQQQRPLWWPVNKAALWVPSNHCPGLISTWIWPEVFKQLVITEWWNLRLPLLITCRQPDGVQLPTDRKWFGFLPGVGVGRLVPLSSCCFWPCLSAGSTPGNTESVSEHVRCKFYQQITHSSGCVKDKIKENKHQLSVKTKLNRLFKSHSS